MLEEKYLLPLLLIITASSDLKTFICAASILVQFFLVTCFTSKTQLETQFDVWVLLCTLVKYIFFYFAFEVSFH
jgi:Flp pilus assembly protein protease CpaA